MSLCRGVIRKSRQIKFAVKAGKHGNCEQGFFSLLRKPLFYLRRQQSVLRPVLVTKPIRNAGHVFTAITFFGYAHALDRSVFALCFIGTGIEQVGCGWPADTAGIKPLFSGLFDGNFFRHIFHHPAGLQMIFFATWCFVDGLRRSRKNSRKQQNKK
jgi:hypothetical protein